MIPFRCILLSFHEHDHDHDQLRGVGVVIPDTDPEMRMLSDLSRVTQLIEIVQTKTQVVCF